MVLKSEIRGFPNPGDQERLLQRNKETKDASDLGENRDQETEADQQRVESGSPEYWTITIATFII